MNETTESTVDDICDDCGTYDTDQYPLVSCSYCGRKLCQIDSRCIERHAANDTTAAQYGCPKSKTES